MSTTTTAHAPPADPHAPGHAHVDPDAHLAHHFDTPQQQFDSGKLGIWIFLVTEILFFSGLFCAYAVLRAHHPEMFVYASTFLDTTWGAINTCVLIISSLTAAWAVRNAQLGQRRALIVNILITILCAFGFMAIKYVEYAHKIHLGLTPGGTYSYDVAVADAAASGVPAHQVPQRPEDVKNVQLFFSVYFMMTGLHGFHVLAGIIVWLWILVRALKKQFGPKYFGPVDFVALYWHIVDIVWIYLFPLLYLIN